MVEIKIPKEIRTYESKVVGPFTTRQAVCAVGIGAECLFVYSLLGNLIGRDAVFALCFFLAVPFFAFGWLKPYGMVFEQFGVCVLRSIILAPKIRKYKTINYYELLQKEIQKEDKRMKEIEAKQNKTKIKSVKYKKDNRALK